ncbi:MAG: lysylphosphatidylglycerol synthase domain-containing protein [Bacteroidia bacterium]|nr:lysylphosphatidylglycerol synthase domain-containing protein [Bacteroidia bacterium]
MSKTKIVTNLFFFVGFAILAYMIYKIGLDVIWNNIKLTGWWFVAIIGIWGVVYLVNTFAFHTIIRDGSPEAKSVGFLKTFKLTISGYAINLITPFGLLGGEPYKIIELQPKLGIQKATSSVLLYMMMHFVSHFIFWMVSIPLLFFIVPNVSVPIRVILIIAGIASLLLLWWAFTVYSNGFISKALSIAGKIPFVGKKMRAYKEKHIEKIVQMDFLIADLYKNRKKDFITSLSLELLSRYILCIEVIFMMYAIGLPIGFAQSVIIESIQSMVGNLFFFMPMQLGAREGGFILVFGILSLPAAHAVYVSLCIRIRELVWTLIGLGLMKVGKKG